MLSKKELLSETVELDGTSYTVTAFTVRRRTAFEAQLRRTGPESLRECTLIFCCTLGSGQPAFSAADFSSIAEASEKYTEQSRIKGVDTDALLDDLALDLLVEDLSTYPEAQLEPLVMACYRVNGLLGNDSSPN